MLRNCAFTACEFFTTQKPDWNRQQARNTLLSLEACFQRGDQVPSRGGQAREPVLKSGLEAAFMSDGAAAGR